MQEAPHHRKSNLAATFRVELRSHQVAALHRRTDPVPSIEAVCEPV
jgi:hypothetical protein